MLKNISFKNYKAFDQGSLDIKPITILLGANSVGKSSIMQLFLLLQQTFLSEENYKSALRLNGGFITLGEGINILRKKEDSRVMSLSFTFTDEAIYKNLKTELFTTFVDEFYFFAKLVNEIYNKVNISLDVLEKLSRSIKISSYKNHANKEYNIRDKNYFHKLIDDTHQILKRQTIKDIPKSFSNSFFFNKLKYNYYFDLIDSKDEFLLTYDFLHNISEKISSSNFKIDFDIALSETALYANQLHDRPLILKKVTIENEGINLISIGFKTHRFSTFRASNVESELIDFGVYNKQTLMTAVNNIFVNPRTIFSFSKKDVFHDKIQNDFFVFANALNSIFEKFLNSFGNYFLENKINYVGPLRAHPKRYYFLDKAKVNKNLDTLDGDAIAEILRANNDLKIKVNLWLKKFNIEIDVKVLQDVIHKIIVDQDSLSLDITDVGFGISQVLPVIIQGFFATHGSITLIEQPEIHLHPKMQADLADLFIDIVLENQDPKNFNKFLIIETHSDYLLKRLRRRISEGIISSEIVGIYSVDPQIIREKKDSDEQEKKEDKGAEVKNLNVQEKGDFDWPVDFYGGEILNDTLVFLKNQ